MEGYEENTVPKPHTDEQEHKPQQRQEHLHIGLGFQPSPSDDHVPPPPPSPSPPPPDDINQRTTNEELQNKQIVNQELQSQQPISEKLQNQQFENQYTVSEELQNQQLVNEEFENQDTVSEALPNQQAINEGLQNLILEEKDKLSEKRADNGDDVEGPESEANEKGADREANVESEDRNENDATKGEEGIDDGNDYDDDDRSENEKDDDNGNENVGGDTELVTGLKEGSYRRYHYPVRPDAEDCPFYMRTGTCKFGSNCKFNHPLSRKYQAGKQKVKENEENPERPGQTECKYFLRSGGCKFGKACRYNHSRGRTPVAPTVEFNFLGLPIRPGEKECPFYMRNGSCKYGSNCRFNHPDPSAVGGGENPSGYINGESVSLQGASLSTMPSWSAPRALSENGPFVPLMPSPTQGVPSSNLEWNGYQASVYPTPERSLPTPPAFAPISPAETNFYTHHKQQMLIDEFPERPGQPECSYFLKTGDCKYRSGCKFHHPKNRMPMTATFAVSDKGLPLRPDQNICSHYNRYGICKLGPACKFDHPVNYNHSGSAAESGPDKPSPFGNSITKDPAKMGEVENGSEALIQQPV